MTTKKTTSKKLVAKKTTTRTKKAKPNTVTLAAFQSVVDVGQKLWVISERRLMTWTPIEVFLNEAEARDTANMYDAESRVSFNKYKVDAVYLTANPPLQLGLEF